MARTDVKRHGFAPSDCSEDDARIAYLVLNAGPDAFSDIGDIPEAEYLAKLYEEVIAEEGYIRFIVTNVTDSRQEKQSILATTGDSYAATFSGNEPQVISVQGYFVHDYRYDSEEEDAEAGSVSDSMRTWYIDFMYLYEYYLRASRLAKWQSTVTFNLPDFGSYDGYMLSVNTSQAADNDIVVPFNFQMLVTNRHGIKLSQAEKILSAGSKSGSSRSLRDDLSGTARVNGRRNMGEITSESAEVRPVGSTEADTTPTTPTTYNPENAYSGLGIAGAPYAETAYVPPTMPQVDQGDVEADQRLQSLYNLRPENNETYQRLANVVNDASSGLEEVTRWVDRLGGGSSNVTNNFNKFTTKGPDPSEKPYMGTGRILSDWYNGGKKDSKAWDPIKTITGGIGRGMDL